MKENDSLNNIVRASAIPSKQDLVVGFIKNKDNVVTSALNASKVFTGAAWNTNGFFNLDGTIKLTADNYPLRAASTFTLKELNGDKHLLGIVNYNASITDISKSLVDGFSSKSNLYGPYNAALKEQNTFLSLTPKLSGILGSHTSAFVTKNISPLIGSITEIGLTSVNTGRLYATGKLTPQTFKLTEDVSSLCLQSVQVEQNSLSILFSQIKKSSIEDYLPSTPFIGIGINTVLHSLPAYPFHATIPQLRKIEEIVKLDKKEISKHQKDLDSLLMEIDPELVEYRLGCWEAFNKKGKDYIGQASSSMRRLVDKLIRIMAPIEEVEKTKYFQNSTKAKDSKGRPTREARIYYVANYEKDKANHVGRLAKGFIEAWDNLSAWDHEPIDKDGFVYGSLIVIEGHLISLLSQNKG